MVCLRVMESGVLSVSDVDVMVWMKKKKEEGNGGELKKTVASELREQAAFRIVPHSSRAPIRGQLELNECMQCSYCSVEHRSIGCLRFVDKT